LTRPRVAAVALCIAFAFSTASLISIPAICQVADSPGNSSNSSLDALSGEYADQNQPDGSVSFYAKNGKLVIESDRMVPTTENLCIEIFRRMRAFPKAKLERVRVEETSNNSFEYTGDAASDSEAAPQGR